MKGFWGHGLLPTMMSATLLISGCLVYPGQNGDGYGRSPNRYHKQGVVRFDSNLGVYIVVGRPDYYYFGNNYYRYERDRWYTSKRLDRDWREYRGSVPRGLAKKYEHHKRSRGHRKYRSWRDR